MFIYCVLLFLPTAGKMHHAVFIFDIDLFSCFDFVLITFWLFTSTVDCISDFPAIHKFIDSLLE